MIESCLIRLLSLHVILCLFIQEANFKQGIYLSLNSKSVGKNRILEVADCLVNLIGLCKNDAKLIEYFTLLVEVW